ncbi:flavoprotein [Streptomyces sp. NBC_01754]|uniref:flavoprotein n=1 Tax=Streptomyces sp. NBC_01754 TaxID=2975930 RepID=UPI002DD7B75C|nr:flavoprotein [Streptomyces sp. NBC_01754]WSC93048.1 flavoprotein [Streptomyces sp. NBC_01754]
MTAPTPYLFCAAAPPLHYVAGAIEDAQARGWTVRLGLTPTAAAWLEDHLGGLEALTGNRVRSTYRRPGDASGWPAPDVIHFAPITANSLNAWALGLTPSWPVGVVVQAAGKGTPMVAMPCVNQALAAHPQVDRSVAALRDMGVTVLYGEGGWAPNPSGQGRPTEYPWHLVTDAADRFLPQQ